MEHGTASKYAHDRCRCTDCTYANTAAKRAWRTEQKRLAQIGRAVENLIKNPTREGNK